MNKYYKILRISGVTNFVKTKEKDGNSIEISCHEEDPYLIHWNYMHYRIINDKLENCSKFGTKYENYNEYFEEITEEIFNEMLKKFLEKI